jgi:integrase
VSGKLPPMPKDIRTRYQSVYARHRKNCAIEQSRKCDCSPSFYGVAYDRSAGRSRKTRRAPSASAARDLRADLLAAIDRGEVEQRSDLRVGEASDRFLEAVWSGVALNKNGRRYKRRAAEDLADALRGHAIPRLGRQKRLSDVRLKDCQRICDEMVEEGLSGSRVRSVINAIRSLYRWARRRELVMHDPAQDVQLPAMDATPRDRVVSPAELRRLLDVLEPEDALPYALAAYATARRAEVLALDWPHVDFDRGVIELGADPQARKYDASWRVVPMLAPLGVMVRRAFLVKGRPGSGLVCPPYRHAKTARLSCAALTKRADRVWREAHLERVTLHDCRHSAASWMSVAGVPPAVVSRLMGHALQLGGAAVTDRYTHALPDDLDGARRLLDEFIAERERRETG